MAMLHLAEADRGAWVTEMNMYALAVAGYLHFQNYKQNKRNVAVKVFWEFLKRSFLTGSTIYGDHVFGL